MDESDQEPDPDQAATYQIRVGGRLPEKWSDWFGRTAIIFESGTSTLTGTIADQAALRGILSRIWDLNLTLISVTRIEQDTQHHSGGAR